MHWVLLAGPLLLLQFQVGEAAVKMHEFRVNRVPLCSWHNDLEKTGQRQLPAAVKSVLLVVPSASGWVLSSSENHRGGCRWSEWCFCCLSQSPSQALPRQGTEVGSTRFPHRRMGQRGCLGRRYSGVGNHPLTGPLWWLHILRNIPQGWSLLGQCQRSHTAPLQLWAAQMGETGRHLGHVIAYWDRGVTAHDSLPCPGASH